MIELLLTQWIKKPTTVNLADFLAERVPQRIRKTVLNTEFNTVPLGGAGGIRTHGTRRYNWFRVSPVMTTSIPLPICSAAVFSRFFSVKKCFGKNWRKEQQIIQFFEPGKTRMVTRFRLDETDSSPQDFESVPLWPLRYHSVFNFAVGEYRKNVISSAAPLTTSIPLRVCQSATFQKSHKRLQSESLILKRTERTTKYFIL